VPAVLIVLFLYYLGGPEYTLTRPYGQPPVEQPKAPTSEHATDLKVDAQPHHESAAKASPIPATTTRTSAAAAVTTPTSSSAHKQPTKTYNAAALATGKHPIDNLIREADEVFNEKLKRESHSLEDAAAEYRKRRGRHPPPGFKEWYEFAKEKKAIIVEDFWDQIYHDLEPFWGLDPERIRKDAWDFEMRISIRDKKAATGSDWFWTQIWLKLIQTIEHLLPDMDLALNAMDEPRVIAPWEEIDKLMTEAHKTRTMKDPESVVATFSTLFDPKSGPEKEITTPKKTWVEKNKGKMASPTPEWTVSDIPVAANPTEKPYWMLARAGCPPDSLARTADTIHNFDVHPRITNALAAPHTRDGYVSNYTLSTDICHQPDLQGLNGMFVEPLSISSTDAFFPLFGGSKLSVNNEILLPAPMYWNEEERFMGAEGAAIPWEEKKDGVIWRGVATGGRNRETNWKAFQRHRFVAMNNGTKLNLAQTWKQQPANFDLPSSAYGLKALEENKMGEWVKEWADVAFVDLACSPDGDKGPAPAIRCNYTDPEFDVLPGMKMAEQFKFKYLPDIDGNSFSGRYLGFLRSTSLPIKSTVWREWHDSRLTAWKHFVPMDNRYTEWWGIMEYFLGYGKETKGHDEVAEAIAMQGREWADKALRKEDMQVYVLRLLLEYARLSDEKRESMGFVEDLLKKDGTGDSSSSDAAAKTDSSIEEFEGGLNKDDGEEDDEEAVGDPSA